MVLLAFTRRGLEDALRLALTAECAVWCGSDASSEGDYANRGAACLSRFICSLQGARAKRSRKRCQRSRSTILERPSGWRASETSKQVFKPYAGPALACDACRHGCLACVVRPRLCAVCRTWRAFRRQNAHGRQRWQSEWCRDRHGRFRLEGRACAIHPCRLRRFEEADGFGIEQAPRSVDRLCRTGGANPGTAIAVLQWPVARNVLSLRRATWMGRIVRGAASWRVVRRAGPASRRHSPTSEAVEIDYRCIQPAWPSIGPASA
jgi:hypothetical protein